MDVCGAEGCSGVEAACQPVPCAAPLGLCLGNRGREREKEEERAPAREDEERCGRFLSFFPVQGLCGSGGCGHAAAAGGLLPKRVEESESVLG